MKPYTTEEKIDLIKKFEKFLSQGIGHKAALKRVGVAQSTIRIWKIALEKEREKCT